MIEADEDGYNTMCPNFHIEVMTEKDEEETYQLL